MRQCPRCASEINVNDKVCPRCGLPTDRMEFAEQLEEEAKSTKLNSAQKKEKRRLAKKERKEAKRQKKLENKISSTDFAKLVAEGNNNQRQVRGRKKEDKTLKVDIDENGEFNIDTSDVEIIGDDTMKILEEKRQQTYSVKKARGDYRPTRIKWWEIYKLADRSFARRKIKREVSKAARVKPDKISKTKLFFLCLFFGWIGVHNFYAKNTRKGWVSLILFTIASVGNMLIKVPFFESITLWLVGCTGFVVIFIWISDLVNIIFNQFSYRIQRDKFIATLNVETRAKLGEKYIDLELLQKPWYVRFKVWWQKKKRNYQEWQHERRQYLIEKEKRKLEKKAEQEKINQEISEFENKENAKIEAEKKSKKEGHNEAVQSSDDTDVDNAKEVKKSEINKIAEVEEIKTTPTKKKVRISVNTKTKAQSKTKKK